MYDNICGYRFATPYFNNRQEMFDFIEQIPEGYDCYKDFMDGGTPRMFSSLVFKQYLTGLDATYHEKGKVWDLNLIEIEVTEAICKTVNELVRKGAEAMYNYEKLKLFLAWIKKIKQTCKFKFEVSITSTCFRMGVFYKAKCTWFFDSHQWLDYDFFNLSYARFEEKIGGIEAEYENNNEIENSKSLNDDFKMLELQPKIDQALADLKAKMNL